MTLRSVRTSSQWISACSAVTFSLSCRYANRAKNIKNKPQINEDPKDALLREYQEEIMRLKVVLDKRKKKGGQKKKKGGGGGGGEESELRVGAWAWHLTSSVLCVGRGEWRGE